MTGCGVLKIVFVLSELCDININLSLNSWTNVSPLPGHFTPEPDPDNDIGSLQSKYSLDRRREDEQEKESSPPKSPPPFSKAESRFEREQRIKVGSLDSYTPGNTLPRQKRYHHCPWLQEDDLMLVLLSASVLLQSSLEPSKLTRESGSEWNPGE